MTVEQIKDYIKSHDIHDAVKYFLYQNTVPAINGISEYERYKELVKIDHPRAENVLIGGSGNWGYSFNPRKLFRPFCSESDIDLIVVSSSDFIRAWNSLRKYHRENWYRIGSHNQMELRRNGENVYSGFISLKWISDYKVPDRIDYEEMVDSYSNKIVNYKKVNLMYFRNETELVDYYIRSFRIVRES